MIHNINTVFAFKYITGLKKMSETYSGFSQSVSMLCVCCLRLSDWRTFQLCLLQ